VVRDDISIGQDLLGVSYFHTGIGCARDGAAHPEFEPGATKATAAAAGGRTLRKQAGSSAQANTDQASFH
jgi:hypothetical protein